MSNKKKYLIERDIKACEGFQAYAVEAESPEEAYEILSKGKGTLVENAVDIVDIADFTVDDIQETDEEIIDWNKRFDNKDMLNPSIILCPSIEIWDYFKGDISIDLITSSIADKMAGFHISYSANELLKDLDLLTPKGAVSKRGLMTLARSLHWRYHAKTNSVAIVNPHTNERFF